MVALEGYVFWRSSIGLKTGLIAILVRYPENLYGLNDLTILKAVARGSFAFVITMQASLLIRLRNAVVEYYHIKASVRAWKTLRQENAPDNLSRRKCMYVDRASFLSTISNY